MARPNDDCRRPLFLHEIMQTLGGGTAQHGDVSPLEVGRRLGGAVRSGLLRSGPQLSCAEPERRLGRLVHACDEQRLVERPRQGRAEGNGVTALEAPVISDDDRHGYAVPSQARAPATSRADSTPTGWWL